MIKLIDILNETTYVLSNNKLEDLYDFQVTIEDGEIIEDDEDYITLSSGKRIDSEYLYYQILHENTVSNIKLAEFLY